MKIVLLVSGPKGAGFLRNFRSSAEIECVVSYASKGLRFDAYADIQAVCRERGYKFLVREEARGRDYAAADLILLIGWQWIEQAVDRRHIVFHDSLLPRLRGFNPTVTALIAGDAEIGVSAFRPADGDPSSVDTGPVFGQEKISIRYPITIQDAYKLLGPAYSRLAERLVNSAGSGTLSFLPQDSDNTTYSLWRDEDDYWIDWKKSAEEIRRFVDAVGWPYMGAKCKMQGREIRIDSVEVADNLMFANRHPGKVWSLSRGMPIVVCGSGTLRILEAREADGAAVAFGSLRVRLE
jgi:methionyl-tRNA formyltransferase